MRAFVKAHDGNLTFCPVTALGDIGRPRETVRAIFAQTLQVMCHANHSEQPDV